MEYRPHVAHPNQISNRFREKNPLLSKEHSGLGRAMGLALGVIGQLARFRRRAKIVGPRLDSNFSRKVSVQGIPRRHAARRDSACVPSVSFPGRSRRSAKAPLDRVRLVARRSRFVASLPHYFKPLPQQLLSPSIPSTIECTAPNPSSFFGIAGCPAIARHR